MRWLWSLLVLCTISILIGAVLAVQRITIGEAAGYGDYIAGIAATLAFLWLIAGFAQQSRELRLQREELKLQRESLNLQKDELQRIAKYNALHQIATILRDFEASLIKRGMDGIRSSADLHSKWNVGMVTLWKRILDGQTTDARLSAWIEWLPIQNLCFEFLSTVVVAINFYSEATNELEPVTDDEAPAYIYFNHEALRRIPVLQGYLTSAFAVATAVFLTMPSMKRVQIAGLEAMDRKYPGTVDQDGLEKLRREVSALDERRRRPKEN